MPYAAFRWDAPDGIRPPPFGWGQPRRPSPQRTTMAAMTFEDLPPRANEIPLTNQRVAADVIDLIISDADRAAGCVAVMICDSEDRGIQPVVLHDVPHDADA